MNKDRYAEFDWHRQDRESPMFREPDWFDHLQAHAHVEIVKHRLAARKTRQATQTYPKSFKSLATRLKRFLGLS